MYDDYYYCARKIIILIHIKIYIHNFFFLQNCMYFLCGTFKCHDTIFEMPYNNMKRV